MGTVGLVVLYCDHLRSVTNNFARLFISAFPSARQVQPHQISKLQLTAQGELRKGQDQFRRLIRVQWPIIGRSLLLLS